MIFVEKLVEIGPYTINIHTNDVQNPRYIWLMLWQGERDGSFINNFTDIFDEQDLVISPDYPGRGKSGRYGGESIADIAIAMQRLCETLMVKNARILAFSFGTMIATEMLAHQQQSFEQVYLFAPGQYYTKPLRTMYSMVFLLPVKYTQLYRLFRQLLLKLNIFEHFPIENLDIINKQWLSTLSYVLPLGKVETPTTIFHFDKDEIVDKQSLSKLNAIYIRSDTILIHGKHPKKTNDILALKERMRQIVNP